MKTVRSGLLVLLIAAVLSACSAEPQYTASDIVSRLDNNQITGLTYMDQTGVRREIHDPRLVLDFQKMLGNMTLEKNTDSHTIFAGSTEVILHFISGPDLKIGFGGESVLIEGLQYDCRYSGTRPEALFSQLRDFR